MSSHLLRAAQPDHSRAGERAGPDGPNAPHEVHQEAEHREDGNNRPASESERGSASNEGSGRQL